MLMSGRVRWSCGPVVVWLVIASPEGSTGIGCETWSLTEHGKRTAQRWWWQQAGWRLWRARALSLSLAPSVNVVRAVWPTGWKKGAGDGSGHCF